MNYSAITQYIEQELKSGNTVDNRQITKLCNQNSLDTENLSDIKEAVEIGLMHLTRNIAQTDEPIKTKYDRIIDLYNRQPYVGTKRTLDQIVKQQYSTALPIAYLMSQFVKGKSDSLYFEPSAGNGFLTVALPQENTICNEIDNIRLQNLREESYRKVTSQDAAAPFQEYNKLFDGVITNPPFVKNIDTMIFNALDTMKDNGRCAILRDGLNTFEDYYGSKHRKSFVTFYDRLISEYNVVKIINLNSKKIYAKQGTAFFMHIILIDGRKTNPAETSHRLYNPEVDKAELAGFTELWEYFSPYFENNIDDSHCLLCNELRLLNLSKQKSLDGRNVDQLTYWINNNTLIDGNIDKTKKMLSGSQFNSAQSEHLLRLLNTYI